LGCLQKAIHAFVALNRTGVDITPRCRSVIRCLSCRRCPYRMYDGEFSLRVTHAYANYDCYELLALSR